MRVVFTALSLFLVASSAAAFDAQDRFTGVFEPSGMAWARFVPGSKAKYVMGDNGAGGLLEANILENGLLVESFMDGITQRVYRITEPDGKTYDIRLSISKAPATPDLGEMGGSVSAPKRTPEEMEQVNENIKKERDEMDQALGIARLVDEPTLAFTLPLEGTPTILRPYRVSWMRNGVRQHITRNVTFLVPRNTPVLASADGVVAVTQHHAHYRGNTVLIDHGAGIFSRYDYLNSIAVNVGDSVKQGQVIGASGKTGLAERHMLGWGLYHRYNTLNPMLFVK